MIKDEMETYLVFNKEFEHLLEKYLAYTFKHERNINSMFENSPYSNGALSIHDGVIEITFKHDECKILEFHTYQLNDYGLEDLHDYIISGYIKTVKS